MTAAAGEQSGVAAPIVGQWRDADVIVVGAGLLAGLVATAGLIDAGRKVILVWPGAATSLGVQAFWSFDGQFLADIPAGHGPVTPASRLGRLD